jgi:cobalt-precorrin-5B (C1)-methyltransferase
MPRPDKPPHLQGPDAPPRDPQNAKVRGTVGRDPRDPRDPRGPEPPRTDAPLREPELPRTARVAARTLRTGWTTGTCAAAAAKAAAAALLSGQPQERVEVGLPRSARRVSFPVARCQLGDGWAEAVVVKDAGDDPDVTNGAHLTAWLGPRAEPGLRLEGGEGVGTVTRPGLGLEVGGPAINPVPRRQIAAAVGEVIDLSARGVHAVISVPGGERMARKTTNPRLGIVGGISILGTTGIVRPFSTAAWRASVEQAIDVIAAEGLDTVVLSTGGRTERAAMRLHPDLDEVCFVEVGDFTGHALRRAAARGLARCVFVGMAGKLAKLGAGVMMTHWTRSRVDPDLLACLTADAGGDPDLVAAVGRANTARHAYELWAAAGLTAPCDLLCDQVAGNLSRFCEGRLEIEVVMVDFDSLEAVGRSRSPRSGAQVPEQPEGRP